jgi:PP-loop superfamily ATP-utilizing enzyme
MSNTAPNIEEFSREDLLRILHRDRFVKEQLSGRVASLMHENLELMAIVQELQQTLVDLRESATVLGNGDTEISVPADVTSS